MPLFWSEKELKELEGCSFLDHTMFNPDEMERDYKDKIAPFVTEHKDLFLERFTTESYYRQITSWVRSLLSLIN